MATKKASAKKPSTKPAAAPKASAPKVTVTSSRKTASTQLDSNLLNIVLAEVVGTFVLTMVALMTVNDVVPLFVGLTLAVLVMAIGGVSGAHVNPAVTFGLWVAGKVKPLQGLFYWAAQFIGAMAAVVVLNLVAGTKMGLDFGHFGEFSWAIFMIEMVGTAVFLFGLVSVLGRTDLSNNAKAFGVGLSLMAGILVAGSLYAPAREAAIANYQNAAQSAQTGEASDMSQPEIPHLLYANGATLNPAVALAATELTDSQLKGGMTGAEDEAHYSRLSMEVISATLVGAAVGALVARMVNYRFKS